MFVQNAEGWNLRMQLNRSISDQQMWDAMAVQSNTAKAT